ncbi:MAG TPA: glycosyltransferase family A protein [Devosiaceae bacterium]|jgi:hypothetical protein|nr:glycosyltransferase family A protein [Devosiaceae bacterium]
MRLRVPLPIKQAIKSLLRAEQSAVQSLDEKLWGGFSSSALDDLLILADDPEERPVRRAEACLSIARWTGAAGRYQEALAFLQRTIDLDPVRYRRKSHAMLAAQFLCRLGETARARQCLEAHAWRGFHASRELYLANTWNPEVGIQIDPDARSRVLRHINNVYRHFGLCDVVLRDNALPLSLDNIKGDTCRGVTEAGHSVTVILPLFNAEATIVTALQSLAEQSWRALKVIVVDDCSTDASCQRVEAFCRLDSRFSLIRKTENSGSYVSRNMALEQVETPYVTVHDADDWSHPQKLEMQVKELRSSSAPYNYTMLCRATPGLHFVGGTRPFPQLVGPNHSSGLFRTDEVRRAGGWDTVRISGDTELFWRMEALSGNSPDHSRSRRIMASCPLSFSRHLEGSLTQAGPTHGVTLYHGVRREYREAAAFWHTSLKPGMQPGPGPYFPAPALIRVGAPPERQHDLVVVGDFNHPGPATRNAMAIWELGAEDALDIAILHYPGYHRDVTRPLSHEVRAFAGRHDIRILAPGERASARLTLVAESELLHHRMDRFPELESENSVVLIDSLPMPSEAPRADPAAPAALNESARTLLGSNVRLAPNCGLAAAALKAVFPQGLEAPIKPAIDRMFKGSTTAGPNGAAADRRPVLGGFVPDTETLRLWDPETLLAAYCADTASEVLFLGSLKETKRHLGRLPRNWRGIDAMTTSPASFFSMLDIFLHFPHPQSRDMLGYPALFAMAAGLPVVTEKRFTANFDEAALHVDAKEVWGTVQALWGDPGALRSCAAAGEALVREEYSSAALSRRLGDYGLRFAGFRASIQG